MWLKVYGSNTNFAVWHTLSLLDCESSLWRCHIRFYSFLRINLFNWFVSACCLKFELDIFLPPREVPSRGVKQHNVYSPPLFPLVWRFYWLLFSEDEKGSQLVRDVQSRLFAKME